MGEPSQDNKKIPEIMAPFGMYYRAVIESDWRSINNPRDHRALLNFDLLKNPLKEEDRLAQAMLELVRSNYDGNIRFACYPIKPQIAPAPEPEVNDYEQRVNRLRTRLNEAFPDQNVGHIGALYNGWLAVIEAAVNGMIDRTLAEPGASFRIMQMKEKFGSLRLYVAPNGSGEYGKDIRHIAQWAEFTSESRCMVTGEPGERDELSWVLTLSPKMSQLRQSDPDAFQALLNPSI